MNTRRHVPAALALALGLTAFGGRAEAQGVALAVKAGTTGIGADLTVGLARSLNVRVGGAFFSYSREVTESDIEFDARATLSHGSLLLDLHPGGGNFRISAGGYYSGTKATGDSVGGTILVNGVPYDVRLVGTLNGEMKGKSIAPYLGLGWGNAVREGARVRFVADLGVYYWGSPSVTLTANPTNPALVPPSFYQDLEAERRQLEDDLSKYKLYPVLSLGVSYRF
jgi:hypothetical protein